MAENPGFTIIIPTLNEQENIAALLVEIDSVCTGHHLHPEIIVTDAGSVDGTHERVLAAETSLQVTGIAPHEAKAWLAMYWKRRS